MSPGCARPEFWYPALQMLLILNVLLLAAVPGGFARISARVNRELIYAGAFVRRYLLAAARDLVQPPLRARKLAAAPSSTPRSRRRPLDKPSPRRAARQTPQPRPPARRPSSPDIGWALALRHPLPIARRFARGAAPRSRDLAIPWHVIRAPPGRWTPALHTSTAMPARTIGRVARTPANARL